MDNLAKTMQNVHLHRKASPCGWPLGEVMKGPAFKGQWCCTIQFDQTASVPQKNNILIVENSDTIEGHFDEETTEWGKFIVPLATRAVQYAFVCLIGVFLNDMVHSGEQTT